VEIITVLAQIRDLHGNKDNGNPDSAEKKSAEMKPKSVGFPLDGKKLRYTRGNGEKSRSILAEIAMHFNVMMLQRQKKSPSAIQIPFP